MRTHRILTALFTLALLAPAAASAQQSRAVVTRTWVTGRGMLGFTSQAISGAGLHQRRVVEVVPDSPAERAGLAVGDTLLRINGLAASPQVMSAPFEPGDTVTLRIQRNGRERDLTLVAAERPNHFRYAFPDSLDARFAVTFERMRSFADSAQFMPSVAIRRLRSDSGTVMIIGTDTLHIDAGAYTHQLHVDTDSIARHFRVRSLPRILADSVNVHFYTPGEGRVFEFHTDSMFPRGFDMLTSSAVFGMRAVAGAELAPLNPALAEYFGATDGVLVVNAAEHTPAERAGLRGGDVIVQAGGQTVHSIRELRRAIEAGSGSEISLRVLRHGRYEDVVISR